MSIEHRGALDFGQHMRWSRSDGPLATPRSGMRLREFAFSQKGEPEGQAGLGGQRSRVVSASAVARRCSLRRVDRPLFLDTSAWKAGA